MNQLSSVLFILLIFAACSQEITEEYQGRVDEIFSEISVSEDLNLYVDEAGQPTDGRYTSSYQSGSTQADVTFSEGKISKGEVFSPDGILTIRYSTVDGLMKTTYYSANNNPRMEIILEDNLSEQVGFYTWDEDGTQRVHHDKTLMKHWHENGQPLYEMQLKDGNVHGRTVSWYEDGRIKKEAHFIHNVENGTFKEWDKEGNLISMQVYDMGELVTEKSPEAN